jgi:hypothetical protein
MCNYWGSEAYICVLSLSSYKKLFGQAIKKGYDF